MKLEDMKFVHHHQHILQQSQTIAVATLEDGIKITAIYDSRSEHWLSADGDFNEIGSLNYIDNRRVVRVLELL